MTHIVSTGRQMVNFNGGNFSIAIKDNENHCLWKSQHFDEFHSTKMNILYFRKKMTKFIFRSPQKNSQIKWKNIHKNKRF